MISFCRQRLGVLLAAAGLAGSALILSAGCSTSQPKAASTPEAAPAPRCAGTLGIEGAPISREARERLKVPNAVLGSLVTDVWKDGPAAKAGIEPGDVVTSVGGRPVDNDCEFSAAAFNRACGPVTVTVRRAGADLQLQVDAVEQDALIAKACAAGSASACFRQGWLLWTPTLGPNSQKALDIFTSACRAGSADACAYEAIELMHVKDASNTPVVAAERACTLKSAAGCAHLAFLYATGTRVRKDDEKAADLYRQSCDLGDPKGCYNVGLMAQDGRGGPKDPYLAAAKYEQACVLGSTTACTNLGFFYERGIGVTEDKARAFALYQEGCAGSSCQASNLGGCVNEGRAYRDGIGTGKDEAKAAEIFREACDRKPNEDDIHSAENGARACSLLGALSLAGDGISKDLAQGRELTEQGCARGDSWGCFNAASIYTAGSGVAADPAKAAGFLEKACSGGDGEGCFDLGVAYEKGNGVEKDRKRAAELKKKACELGFEDACPKKKKK